jgi:hypothetical protein
VKHPGEDKYVNTHAPNTKSSWSTSGNEAPLFIPSLRLKKLLNISPKREPAARDKRITIVVDPLPEKEGKEICSNSDTGFRRNI